MSEAATTRTPKERARAQVRQLRGKGGGGDYLDVKWRLLWFREENPDGTIETEHIVLEQSRAVFRAVVRRGAGHAGSATGYGSETAGDFGDFIEKAETKAIGRALKALGYGFPEDDPDDERIVDAPHGRPEGGERGEPAARAARGGTNGGRGTQHTGSGVASSVGDRGASQGHQEPRAIGAAGRGALLSTGKGRGLGEAEVEALALALYSRATSLLFPDEARYIDDWMKYYNRQAWGTIYKLVDAIEAATSVDAVDAVVDMARERGVEIDEPIRRIRARRHEQLGLPE